MLATSLALALLMWLWRPIRGSVWSIGLRQAWLRPRGIRYSSPSFTERGLYSLIRHPLMAGFLIVLWATPRMTTGHLLFAAVATRTSTPQRDDPREKT